MMVLAQNLYFCSMANNHGALTLIADSAEEEDVKEDMLLYAFLARQPSHPTHCPRLRDDISRFLAERCGASVNLMQRTRSAPTEDGLVSADRDGRLTAMAPEEARAHLDRCGTGCSTSIRSTARRHLVRHERGKSRVVGDRTGELSGDRCRGAAEAEQIASRLEEAAGPPALAVSAIRARHGRFEISRIYAEVASAECAVALIARASGMQPISARSTSSRCRPRIG